MSSPGRSCPRCAAALSQDARFCPACGLPVARLTPGQILDGKYEVLDKIGEGGMGEVWRVRHLHLDEIRIIKVTKPDPSGGGAATRRFQEEARLATLVRHPNVAALYDFSRQPDGSYYMVWEYIDGVTLEAWLRKRGRLPPELALDVARQVLAGLAEIHAQGIVHRDLSPDNIMLRETPVGVRAKIIDLGIAKRIAAESLQMTGTGLFLGKLKYCSPEQAGSLPPGTPIDARSDIYSFGAVLYEMLAGTAPFESSTPEGYLGKHLHAPAPPLPVEDLSEPSGRALSGIVARTLEKKRERRYGSARELADALAAVPVTATSAATVPAPEAEPERTPPRRAPWIAAAAVLVALAAGALLVARGSKTRRGAPERLPARAATSAPAPATASPAAPPATAEVPTAAPAAPPSPPPPPEERAEADDPAARPLSPAAMRQALDLWKASPDEGRARRSPAIARAANRFVATHPVAPLSREIEATLPTYLKRQATGALDRAQPMLAHLYFRAWRQLQFAPADREFESRFESLAATPRQRPPTTPAADGR
jgi:serine/threonine-protein kinase